MKITSEMVTRYCVAWECGSNSKDVDAITEWLMDSSLYTDSDRETFDGWESDDFRRLAEMISDRVDDKLWYAVQKDREDDWGNGSYDLDEAKEMARELREDYPDALIAVIRENDDPECIDEITEF